MSKVDRLYYNGSIYSVDNKSSKYEAIGITGNKISFLGSVDEGMKLEAAERIDLKGKVVLPGFIDSHLHLLNYAFVNQSFKMFACDSIEGIKEEAKEIIKTFNDDKSHWLYGRGWDENKFKDEKRVLTRFDLDEISTERPILFIRNCGHIAAVNSLGLEIVLGLEKTKEYLSQIDKEKGILTEASIKLCYNAMNKPTVDEIKSMILKVEPDYAKEGITAVEADNFLSLPGRDWRSITKAFNELKNEKKLTLRVREQASFTEISDLKDFIEAGNGMGDGNSFYSIGPVKLYQDGSLGAKTALMNDPYPGTDSFGTATHSQEELDELVSYAYKNNMQIIVHTIGDRASDMVEAAYEKAIAEYGDKGLRLAINHLQIVSPDLFDRMKAHNILCYIQPVFVASDMGIVPKLIPDEKLKLSYAWKSMINKGLVTCGGSDSPVERFSVLENIQIAVTRDRLGEITEGWMPEEKVSVDEAIRMFTINNCYGAFSENERGTLEIGKLADITILDADPYEVEPHDISKIKVAETIVDGKTVYKL